MIHWKDIEEILSIKVIGIVPEDPYITISTNIGEPAVLNDSSIGGRELKNIVRRMLGEDIPLTIYQEKESFIDKISNFFKREKKQ